MSKAYKTGMICYLAAVLLALFDVSLAVAPLFLFVGICMTAPFVTRLSFFLPIVSHGKTGQNAISITFDDGPDPRSTEPLLNLLDCHGVKATFFVVGKKAAAHPHLIQNILDRGHSLGNHTYRHDNLCMLKSSRYLYNEINRCQAALAPFHIKPIAFRPPVGITNPKLSGILVNLGMFTVNFSSRGHDFGNRHLEGLSKRVLAHLQGDQIIALHDVSPQKDPLTVWLIEMDKLLRGIKEQKFDILPLSELIKRPVMVGTYVQNRTMGGVKKNA